MSNKGSRKPNYTAAPPTNITITKNLHICSHQGFGDHHKKEKAKQENIHKEKGYTRDKNNFHHISIQADF